MTSVQTISEKNRKLLSRIFNTEMRVVRESETGNLLVAEAGEFQLSAMSDE